MTADTDSERSRLYWRCRRGMLELDLLLGEFCKKNYEQLSTQDKQAFEMLLSYPDDTLLEYLMGRILPTDRRLHDVIHQIRSAA
jgi:antitoxin CptB